MTRDLRIAVCGEGSTDTRVVPILIGKIIDGLRIIEPVDLTIDIQEWNTRLPFPEAVVSVVKQVQPLFKLVVAHVDADHPDESRVREYKILPAQEALARAQLKEVPVIWAVPVQAIEAWLLASAESIAKALTNRSQRERELQLPDRPDQMHRDEAKRLLNECVYTLLARTNRQRRRIQPHGFHDIVAREIPLRVLRRLPAFGKFEAELVQVLTAFGYVGSFS